jgi:hypothetical protein
MRCSTGQENYIVVIDPVSGRVASTLDCISLFSQVTPTFCCVLGGRKQRGASTLTTTFKSNHYCTRSFRALVQIGNFGHDVLNGIAYKVGACLVLKEKIRRGRGVVAAEDPPLLLLLYVCRLRRQSKARTLQQLRGVGGCG